MQIVLGPAIVIGVAMGAVLARMARATLLEVFREDYVRTARSKGLVERVVVVRHALRNALLPVLTISGLQLAAVLGGSVAVERAFSVPGLGFALVKGIQERGLGYRSERRPALRSRLRVHQPGDRPGLRVPRPAHTLRIDTSDPLSLDGRGLG